MEDAKSGLTQRDNKTAQMDIPAINACACYSYGYSTVHRQLAKAKTQREGRQEVTEADVAATAAEACKVYLKQLEAQAMASKKSRLSQSALVDGYQA